jgi:hypothetical protein
LSIEELLDPFLSRKSFLLPPLKISGGIFVLVKGQLKPPEKGGYQQYQQNFRIGVHWFFSHFPG